MHLPNLGPSVPRLSIRRMKSTTAAILFMTIPVPITGTWSIIAINKQTNQIGCAMATCLDSDSHPDNARDFLAHGFAAVPLRGGIMAQAVIQDAAGPAMTSGVPRLRAEPSVAAQDVVNAMTDPEADPGSVTYDTLEGEQNYALHDLRQYGVVTFNDTDPADAYTGWELTHLYRAVGIIGTEETGSSSVTDEYTVSVQGNIVFPGTVEASLEAFEGNSDAEFPERLFGALKQGFLSTGGDVRCADDPLLKGAVLSFLKVVEPDGTYSIDLGAQFGKRQQRSALDSIESDLDAWRQEHPVAKAPVVIEALKEEGTAISNNDPSMIKGPTTAVPASLIEEEKSSSCSAYTVLFPWCLCLLWAILFS